MEDDRQPKGSLIHFDCEPVMTSGRRNPFAEFPKLDKNIAFHLGLLSVRILGVGRGTISFPVSIKLLLQELSVFLLNVGIL
jgi:hypothetical protein